MYTFRFPLGGTARIDKGQYKGYFSASHTVNLSNLSSNFLAKWKPTFEVDLSQKAFWTVTAKNNILTSVLAEDAPKQAWEILFSKVGYRTEYHTMVSEGTSPNEAIALAYANLGSSLIPYKVIRCVPFNFGKGLTEDSNVEGSEYELYSVPKIKN